MPILSVRAQNQGSPEFEWLDISGPTREELLEAAARFGLHKTSMQDCLEPEHLPKHETLAGHAFMIVRYYDHACSEEADTVQELTDKLSIFYGPRFVITVHVRDPAWIAQLREKWAAPEAAPGAGEGAPGARILSDLMRAVFATYEKPTQRALERLDAFELSVFGNQSAEPFDMQRAYYLKRRALVFKRIFRLTQEVTARLIQDMQAHPGTAPYFRDLRDMLDAQYFYAEEILEGLQSLLNLHLSLASHRTNEVMRVLTVFSVFFLPLNFIAGLYGMNFEHMPELKWRHGYLWAVSAMLSVVLALYAWFRHRGWLK